MKGIFAILLISALLIVAGCKSQPGEQGPLPTQAFIGGTSAIKLSLIPNSPPDEVTDAEFDSSGKIKANTGFPFEATVTVENVGESDIETGKLDIKLSGFYPQDFQTDASKLTKSIPDSDKFAGVSKDPDGNKIRGDIAQISFPTGATSDDKRFKYITKLAGNQQFPFKAEACYPYKTKALSQVCLLGDFTKKTNLLCNPTGSRPVSNSGAPIHVTSVSQSVGGKNKAILNFEVKQVGTSDLFKNAATTKCSEDFQVKNRIGVTVRTGVDGLKCLGMIGGQNTGGGTRQFEGEVVLTEGSATFTCIQEYVAGGAESVKTFDIELDYYARDSITKNVLVKHLI